MNAVAVLRTERLVLRPLTVEDTPLLVELDADPEVMRYISKRPPPTEAEIEEVIQRSLGHRWLGFIDDEFVGWYALTPGPGAGDRELGYRLRRMFWGRGLATEGCLALIDHGFDVLGATRIWAQTMAVNHPSRRVMERSGLRYVRTFHLQFDDPIEGTELGEVEYEIRAADRPESTGSTTC